MRDWRVWFVSVFATFTLAVPSHAARICQPEVVSVKIHGKPIVGRTLHSVVRVRCSR